MALASRVAQVLESASWIRRMFEEGERLRAVRGPENVFDLSLGNPILEPPARFREELRRLVLEPEPGMHRYMPNAGYPDTRRAVAEWYAGQTGLPIAAADVLMTCGAGGGLNVLFRCILDPGDQVIVLAPFFAEYRFYVENQGGEIVVVPSGAGFQPDADRIAAAIGPRTKAIVLNSPNNPTGVVYRRDRLAAVGRVLSEAQRRLGHEIYLVSDEPYRRLAYDGAEVPWPFEFHRETVIVTSHSKDLGLAGERIGMLVLGPDVTEKAALMSGLIFANRTLGFVNAPALMQRVVAKIQGESIDVAAYRAKRDRLHEALVEAGYEVDRPEGAFYMFPRCPIEDDVRFAMRLVDEGVLVVPGRGFGWPGWFRISYAVEDRVIEGAIPALARALQNQPAAR